jgi:hypothetical protein|nr:MAG TPA: hypothetical protein [Caudoviricetes sp.]
MSNEIFLKGKVEVSPLYPSDEACRGKFDNESIQSVIVDTPLAILTLTGSVAQLKELSRAISSAADALRNFECVHNDLRLKWRIPE